ncbi:hypothetical protein CAL12_02245 [Bordetella genomosp. 8]|uniref:Deaminase n=1 Tax=Bordetella genomosp. 8 TaxID=1416806 RepID=A0A1W6YFG6_9BORD|nr:PP0621 family protein [Bordetella genomosp. 8]ARP79760.1 hypothetical protein CAL12_02245 [Bordetella genomosp. 8]
MGKVLFWIIVVLVALTIARIAARANARNAARDAAGGTRNSTAGNGAQRARGRSGAARRAVPAEQMVRCAHCGIHLPRSDAALVDGRTWCQEHARLEAKY